MTIKRERDINKIKKSYINSFNDNQKTKVQ